MICIKTQHFSLNRLLLLAIGLWPYHQTKLTRFYLIFLYVIKTSFIFFQVTVLISEHNFRHVIKVISCISLSILYLIKYISFSNIQNVKFLMDNLQQTCSELKDENEIAIIRKYGKFTKLTTIAVALTAIFCLFIFICMPLWTFIIEVFLHINISRPHLTLYIMTEYFVDQEKYYYLIFLHMDMAVSIDIILLIAIGTTLLGYIEHICGMFRIASYRMEQVIFIDILRNNSLKNEKLIHNKIILAIDMHRKALKISEFFLYTFDKPYFFLIVIGIISTSFNLFGIFQNITHEMDVFETLIYFFNIITLFAYSFIANYIAQDITEHNNLFFITVYNVQWYRAPVPMQRTILFLLQKGNKIFQMTISGLFPASLECFASITSTSLSYFTLMYSIQQ